MYHLSVIIEIYDMRLQITISKEKLKLSSNYMRIEENFITVYGQLMGRLIGSFCEFRMYCIVVHIRFKKWQLCGISNVFATNHQIQVYNLQDSIISILHEEVDSVLPIKPSVLYRTTYPSFLVIAFLSFLFFFLLGSMQSSDPLYNPLFWTFTIYTYL